jgi:hypothetical protein
MPIDPDRVMHRWGSANYIVDTGLSARAWQEPHVTARGVWLAHVHPRVQDT